MRDYQVQGLNWMASLHHNGINGILADEMVSNAPGAADDHLTCRVSVKPFKQSPSLGISNSTATSPART